MSCVASRFQWDTSTLLRLPRPFAPYKLCSIIFEDRVLVISVRDVPSIRKCFT